MWRSELETREAEGIQTHVFLRAEQPATYRQVMEAWRHDPAFRAFFVEHLREAPFEAYRWETPPVTASTLNQTFEFVLVNDSALTALTALTVDSSAFAERFAEGPSTQQVVTFANLGGDALLVAPRPVGPTSSYAHLDAFARSGPEQQQHALWRAVGSALARHIGRSPLWLSTAGLGVPWLHVRLDARPKYYCHGPYRRRSP